MGRFPSVEAQLRRLALERESIDVGLIGEQLSALQGVIPSSEVLVELWVEADQLERAQRVLSAALEKNVQAVGDVKCPACGKTSPANFDVCWSCEAALSRAEKVAAVAPAVARARPPIFAVIFGITTVFLAGLLLKQRQLAEYRPSPNVEMSWSRECLDQKVIGKLLWRSCDRDRDGTFEVSTSYDLAGHVVDTLYDSNQDGVSERVDSFDSRGALVERFFDLDGDRRFDRWDEYDAKERLLRRSVDSDGDGRADRIEAFDAGL